MIGAHSEIEWDYSRFAVELEDDPLDAVMAATAEHSAFQTALVSAIHDLKKREPVDRSVIIGERRKQFSIPYVKLEQALTDIGKSNKFREGLFLRGWSQYATDEDLHLAAQALLVEQNLERLEQWVNIFQKRPFPLDPAKLIALVRERDQYPESVLPLRAKAALMLVYHPAVRQLALELLASDQPDWGVSLLGKNFEEGDWHLINNAVTIPKITTEVYHGLGMAIKDLAHDHPSPDAALALVTLYENTPCSHCRERIVEALHRLDLLPAHILEECKFDSNQELRELVYSGFAEVESQ